MYSLAYGRMGDEAVAAITIATTIQDILVVLFQGLSAATAVILGNELGAGHLKRAEKYAVHFFILQFIATVGVAVVLIGIRWPIISLYNITPEVARNVSLCILIFAAYMPAKMFNYACDPVAGLVEVPCVKRNGFYAVHAITASEMALMNIESQIPPDEVIEAMNNIGRAMPAALRETSDGGLAVTPTGTAIAERVQSL